MRLDKILEIKYPFIQGGMANISTGKFAADVSNAGGLGLIGSGGMDSKTLLEEIKICKQNTNKPFGVNIMLLNPYIDEFAEIVIREKIPVVTTGAGLPLKYIDDWKKASIKIFPVISNVLMAKRLEERGVTGIIAEGCEGGGHIGEATTMALIPHMVDNLKIPVIAAGGIGNGRQLYSAFSLGAIGVQLGTCLLVSEECPVHENYKNAILKAKDSDTIVTGRTMGSPVRCLKNKLSKKLRIEEKAGTDIKELEQFTLGSLRKAVIDGDVEMGTIMAGQIAGQLNEILPLEKIFENLVEEFKETQNKMCEKIF